MVSRMKEEKEMLNKVAENYEQDIMVLKRKIEAGQESINSLQYDVACSHRENQNLLKIHKRDAKYELFTDTIYIYIYIFRSKKDNQDLPPAGSHSAKSSISNPSTVSGHINLGLPLHKLSIP